MKAFPCLEFFLALLVATQASDQNRPTALEGVVLEHATGNPIAGAKVKLSVADGSTGVESIQTAGADGKFAFRNVQPGSYRLSASSNGFVTQQYGALLPGGPGRVIAAAAGGVSNLAISLTKAATVSGHARNADGAPLAGVRIELLRRVWTADGFEVFDSVGVAKTNDLGAYRIYWVEPGRYYLLAGAHKFNVPSPGGNEERESYSCTFLGATTPEKAVPVDLQAGVETENMDFTLARLTFHRISGRALDAATGKPSGSLTVELERVDWDICPFNYEQNANDRYDAVSGTFRTALAPAGTYRLRLYGEDAAGGYLSSETTIVVGDSDVEDVRVALGPRTYPSSIPGTVRIEGEPSPTWRPHWVGLRPDGRGPFTGFREALSPREMENLGGIPACEFLRFRECQRIEDDGFLLHGVADGAYRIATAPLPRGYYLKAATLDDADVLSHPLTFPASGNLTLTVSPNGGVVDGVVVDESSRPATGIEAVLIPDNQRGRADLFRRATTDGSGKFTIEGVAPGSYKVFAWQALEPYSYFDPDVLKRFEDRGAAARVSERAHVTVRVPVIPAERDGSAR